MRRLMRTQKTQKVRKGSLNALAPTLALALTLTLALGLVGCGLVSSPPSVPPPPPSSTPTTPMPTVTGGGGLGERWVEGQLLVGYRDEAALRRVVERLRGRVLDVIPRIRAALIALPAGVSVPDAVAQLARERPDGLRYAEPNYLRRLIAPRPTWPVPEELQAQRAQRLRLQRLVFDDPLRPKQYALDVMRAERAWARATGRGVIIGIVDTGMDGTHPELQGKQLEGRSCYDEVPIAPDADSSQNEMSHATHVAGIAAAHGRNGEGIVGVAPEAQLFVVRIFDARLVGPGNGSGYVGDAAVAKCLIWAATVGPDGVEGSGDEAAVLNNSWGGRGYSQTLKEAIDAVVEAGVVFVNSMGNSSEDEVLYPKNYPGVLAVGATDPQDRKAAFSTMGGAISVGAPGVDVLSAVPLWLTRPDGEPYGYMYFSGTSMAAPQVSGAIALLKQLFPDATPYQLQRLLEQTADDVEEPGFDRKTGHGRINVARAVSAKRLPPDGATVLVKVLTRNARPGGERVGVPYVDVILRKDGLDRYFAQTNADGVAKFLNVEPGSYDVLVAGGDATVYRFRTANRLALRGRVSARPGATSEVEFAFNTRLKVTAIWEEPVDVDLLVGEPTLEGEEIVTEWASAKTGARWGTFSPDGTGAGPGPYRESYTLNEEHFPYAAYPLALELDEAAPTPARVIVVVEQNGVVERFGPYELEPGERLPSTAWFDWWENHPDPEKGFEEPGPGAPWVY